MGQCRHCTNKGLEEGDGLGMQHVWESSKLHKGFWWGDMRKRDHLEDPRVDGVLRSGMGRHGPDYCDSG